MMFIVVGPVAQLVSAPPCHGGGRGFEPRRGRRPFGNSDDAVVVNGSVAQLVERSTENRKVTGSMPVGATIALLYIYIFIYTRYIKYIRKFSQKLYILVDYNNQYDLTFQI